MILNVPNIEKECCKSFSEGFYLINWSFNGFIHLIQFLFLYGKDYGILFNFAFMHVKRFSVFSILKNLFIKP